MTLFDLKKWLPGPDTVAKILGGELADYGLTEVSDDEEAGNT